MKPRRENLQGSTYGYLTVEEFSHVKGSAAYWICSCRCGGSSVVRAADLKRGKRVSCGCRRAEAALETAEKNKKPFGSAAYRTLYARYRHGAIKRGIDFQLTEKDFISIGAKECHYCGEPPKLKNFIRRGKTLNGDALFSGVDRIRSDGPYSITNCVPCCKHCNKMKGTLSRDDFLARCAKITEHARG